MKVGIRKESGQALVEFTLMFPIFLGIVLGLAAFSILFYSYITMHLGVREAAVYIVEHPKDNVNIARALACNSSFALNKGALTVQIEPPDTSTITCSGSNPTTPAPSTQWVSGASIAVTLVYSVPMPRVNIPLPGGATIRLGPIPITAKSRMTIE